MNGPILDRHGERAARELANRLQHVPPAYLADPYAFALRFIQDLIVENWRHVEPTPDVLRPHATPDEARQAAERGAALARDLLERKDAEDHA